MKPPAKQASAKGQLSVLPETRACRGPLAVRTEGFLMSAVLGCTQHDVVSQAFLESHTSRLTLVALNTVTCIWAIQETSLIRVSSRSGKSLSVSVSGN